MALLILFVYYVVEYQPSWIYSIKSWFVQDEFIIHETYPQKSMYDHYDEDKRIAFFDQHTLESLVRSQKMGYQNEGTPLSDGLSATLEPTLMWRGGKIVKAIRNPEIEKQQMH